MRYLPLLLAFLLLFSPGCIGGEKAKPSVEVEEKPSSPSSSEVSYEEEIPEEGAETEGQESSPPTPPMVYFFDVHSTAPLEVDGGSGGVYDITSDRPKDGRLILIKSGREELVVWSVPSERYEEALQLLEERADFPIEYLLIPSGYPTSVETALNATRDLDVEEVLVPDYKSRTIPVDGRPLKAGDELEVGEFSLKVLSPIPGRLPGEDGNSVTFQLSYKDRKALFLLDANPALVTVIYNENRDLRGWFVELPQYGRGVGAYPTNLNFFREYGEEAFVLEGAPLNMDSSDPVGDRAILNFIWDVLKRKVYAVWLSPVEADFSSQTLSGEVLSLER